MMEVQKRLNHEGAQDTREDTKNDRYGGLQYGEDNWSQDAFWRDTCGEEALAFFQSQSQLGIGYIFEGVATQIFVRLHCIGSGVRVVGVQITLGLLGRGPCYEGSVIQELFPVQGIHADHYLPESFQMQRPSYEVFCKLRQRWVEKQSST